MDDYTLFAGRVFPSRSGHGAGADRASATAAAIAPDSGATEDGQAPASAPSRPIKYL